jgi:hypothetical protein
MIWLKKEVLIRGQNINIEIQMKSRISIDIKTFCNNKCACAMNCIRYVPINKTRISENKDGCEHFINRFEYKIAR